MKTHIDKKKYNKTTKYKCAEIQMQQNTNVQKYKCNKKLNDKIQTQ